MSIENWRDANDRENQLAQIGNGHSGPGTSSSRNTAAFTVNCYSTDVPDSFICQPEMEQFSHQ
jgi:hypothetical protein